MDHLSESEIYEGITVDLLFVGKRPMFGDLFEICGYENPNFPSSNEFPFTEFESLQFSQVDDYFGVKTTSGEGSDVSVWLYPIVGGEVVDHHAGPFDGIRLSYNVLRNPIARADHFNMILETLSEKLSVNADFTPAAAKKLISKVSKYWLNEGITPGSVVAMEVDY